MRCNTENFTKILSIFLFLPTPFQKVENAEFLGKFPFLGVSPVHLRHLSPFFALIILQGLTASLRVVRRRAAPTQMKMKRPTTP